MLASQRLYFRGMGSGLEWDEGSIQVPEGELLRFNVWPFTSVDDNGGQLFPYKATDLATDEIPDGFVIYFINATGGALNVQNAATPATATHLPFALIDELDNAIPAGAVAGFVRDGLTWRQLWAY